MQLPLVVWQEHLCLYWMTAHGIKLNKDDERVVQVASSGDQFCDWRPVTGLILVLCLLQVAFSRSSNYMFPFQTLLSKAYPTSPLLPSEALGVQEALLAHLTATLHAQGGASVVWSDFPMYPPSLTAAPMPDQRLSRGTSMSPKITTEMDKPQQVCDLITTPPGRFTRPAIGCARKRRANRVARTNVKPPRAFNSPAVRRLRRRAVAKPKPRPQKRRAAAPHPRPPKPKKAPKNNAASIVITQVCGVDEPSETMQRLAKIVTLPSASQADETLAASAQPPTGCDSGPADASAAVAPDSTFATETATASAATLACVTTQGSESARIDDVSAAQQQAGRSVANSSSPIDSSPGQHAHTNVHVANLPPTHESGALVFFTSTTVKHSKKKKDKKEKKGKRKKASKKKKEKKEKKKKK